MTSISIPYETAIEDVKARVTASRTSFHAGMAILPKTRREAMYALYAFCRVVDDIADDSPTREESARGLQQWRERIATLFRDEATDTITAALLPAITTYHLVEKDFQDIIDGMDMDAASVIVAPDAQTLDIYCDRVASAVGRASVRIFGDNSARGMDVAYNLGRAFQLTNILRDLAEDAARGRVYLPAELLNDHGIAHRDPAAIMAHPNLRAVCRAMSKQAQAYFDAADVAMRDCIPSAMKPAKVMRAYYGAIFDKLVAEDWRNPQQRVTLSKGQKLWLVLRALIG